MSVAAAAGMRVQRRREALLRYDPVLLGAVLVLLMFGVVMVYSASAVYAGARLGDGLWFFKRQAAAALAGVVVLLAVMKLGYKRLEPFAVLLVFISLALPGLLHAPSLAHAAAGARRWRLLAALHIQPRHIANVAPPVA